MLLQASSSSSRNWHTLPLEMILNYQIAVVIFLPFLAHFASSQPQPSISLAAPLSELSSSSPLDATPPAQCPIAVQYNVNLGGQQSQDTAPVPIFVATVTITNQQQQPNDVQAWRLGWKFPFNSTIKNQHDVFDSDVVLLNPGSNTPVMESVAVGGSSNSTASAAPVEGSAVIAAGQSKIFGFLGTKGQGKY